MKEPYRAALVGDRTAERAARGGAVWTWGRVPAAAACGASHARRRRPWKPRISGADGCHVLNERPSRRRRRGRRLGGGWEAVGAVVWGALCVHHPQRKVPRQTSFFQTAHFAAARRRRRRHSSHPTPSIISYENPGILWRQSAGGGSAAAAGRPRRKCGRAAAASDVKAAGCAWGRAWVTQGFCATPHPSPWDPAQVGRRQQPPNPVFAF